MAYPEYRLDQRHMGLRISTAARRNILRGLLAGVAALVLGGCASLPNIAPFVEASSQYRSAVVASGAVVEAELIDIGGKEDAAAFGREWAIRIRATDALVSYSQALESIAASGAQGAQSARSVADAVTGLASAAGVALPPAATVGTVTDAATFVYGQIAAVRASAALGEALRNAIPAVDRIATTMGLDLNSAQDIFNAANVQAKTRLVMKYNTESAYLMSLRDERLALYRKPARTGADEERLLQLDRLEESTRSWREPMEAQERALAARRRAGDQLFVSARAALAAWALAHRDLAAAVESGRKVDVTALVASVEEMRGMIKRIQAL
jgi:hypothetical protein